MRSLIFAVLIAFVTLPAMAEDSEKTAMPEKADKAESAQQAATEYVPPPGYKTRRRGDHTVYCQKTTEVGSRFKVEKCFSKEQLVALLAENDRQRREIEQRRSICANAATCAIQ